MSGQGLGGIWTETRPQAEHPIASNERLTIDSGLLGQSTQVGQPTFVLAPPLTISTGRRPSPIVGCMAGHRRNIGVQGPLWCVARHWPYAFSDPIRPLGNGSISRSVENQFLQLQSGCSHVHSNPVVRLKKVRRL
jgi:hypothetical protein